MPRRGKSKNAPVLSVREQLELFLERGTELWDSRVRRLSGLNFSINIKGKADDDSVTFKFTEPDIEDFRSFLLTFRQFISNDEPVYLFKIYNLCQLHITDDKCKEVLAEARSIWQELLKKSGSGITLTVDNKELTPEDITDLWINGHYFHNNIEKRRFLKSLEPHLLDGAKAIFFDHVIETTKVIKHLGENIDVALRQGWLKT